MELYLKLVDMILSANAIKLIKKEEHEIWFLNNDYLIAIEQHDYTYKKQWISNVKEFVQNVNLHFKNKVRPKKLIRISVNDEKIVDLIDNDFSIFQNEYLTSYIINKNTKMQQLTDVVAELFSVNEKNSRVVEQKIQEAKLNYVEAKPYVSTKHSYVTYGLISLITLVMAVWQRFQFNVIDLIDLGAKFNSGILEGQYYRFLTAGFLHTSWIHLISNMFVLFFIGKDIEKYFGKLRFLAIFFVSMLFGNIASFTFSTDISVGASGGVFGLYGALLYMSYHYKDIFSLKYKRMIVAMVAISIGTGFFIEGVDQISHIIGFCAGLGMASVITFPKAEITKNKLYLSTVMVVYLVVMLVYGFNINKENPNNNAYAGEYYLQKKDYPAAEAEFKKAIELGGASKGIYLKLGTAQYAQKNYTEADGNLLHSVDAESFYVLAKNAYVGKERNQALQYISIALFLDPENKKYIYLKGKIK